MATASEIGTAILSVMVHPSGGGRANNGTLPKSGSQIGTKIRRTAGRSFELSPVFVAAASYVTCRNFFTEPLRCPFRYLLDDLLTMTVDTLCGEVLLALAMRDDLMAISERFGSVDNTFFDLRVGWLYGLSAQAQRLARVALVEL